MELDLCSTDNYQLVSQEFDDASSDESSTYAPLDPDFEIGDLPVKLELRYAIESRRTEKGLQMPVIENKRFIRGKLTKEEEARRKVRRERNKVAASRCRVKRKQHVRKLLKESDELNKANDTLEMEIAQLKIEKRKIEEALRSHMCKMQRKYHES